MCMGLPGALWPVGRHRGQPQEGLLSFSLSSSAAATSTEFAPMPLVCGQGVRSLLGAGTPWDLMGSLFPVKYVFHMDIFVQRLNLERVTFS